MTGFHRAVLLVVLCLPVLAAACDDVAPGGVFAAQSDRSVDALFADFYQRLGGGDLLGPAISPVFSYGEVSYQYTMAGLMAYDASLQGQKQYYLAALGLDMGLDEPAVQPPREPKLRYVEGHIIAAMFAPLYDRLGARLAGKPLTEARYNPEMRRYEQFFSNVGFYRLENAPPEAVHLMAYGVWKCGSDCTQVDPHQARVVLPHPTGEPLRKAVYRLGPAFTGFAITAMYSTPDGYQEQVFENLVLMVDPKKPGRVFLRPVTVRLGIEPEPLVSANGTDGMEFISVQGGKGYYVARSFLDYLAQHGGQDAAGPPIGEYNQLREGVYRQCFVNLCLEEHLDLSEPLRVRPAALGHSYLSLPRQGLEQSAAPGMGGVAPEKPPAAAPAAAETAASQPSAAQIIEAPKGEVTVKGWVRNPVIAPGGLQEFNVLVLEQNIPVRDVEPDLTIILPDGTHKMLYMLPTGKDGESRYQLDGLDAPSGTAVGFEICVYYPRGETTCTQGNFLVWQEP